MTTTDRKRFRWKILLLVVGVVGILSIPVTYQLRDAMRRAQVKNNLSQIGIAVQNYHDTDKQ